MCAYPGHARLFVVACALWAVTAADALASLPIDEHGVNSNTEPPRWALNLSALAAPDWQMTRELPVGEIEIPLKVGLGVGGSLSYKVAPIFHLGLRLEALRWEAERGYTRGQDEALSGGLVSTMLLFQMRLPLKQPRLKAWLGMAMGTSFEWVDGEGSGGGGISGGLGMGAALRLSEALDATLELSYDQHQPHHETSTGDDVHLVLSGPVLRAGVAWAY